MHGPYLYLPSQCTLNVTVLVFYKCIRFAVVVVAT